MAKAPLSRPVPESGVLWPRWLFSLAAAVLMALAAWTWFPGVFPSFGFGSPILSKELPEFTETSPARWLNSRPLSVEDLRGKVVLLDVWTFG